ncbi:FluC/FEX family fluoride channel [Agromyces binzhouensis]|uniref:Fluoride-specific ion channel FluC n=1 Tax=Agromyces binzhouensis TaxID=1817495 RepID=A0A4Q2JEX0_9MICO|nr:CrcB family protein [Agromyces binzhouensis]RXZ46315.1 CrcB family protein [Agromyces binzhouensis]
MPPSLAVFVGGLAGTGLRLALDTALPHADDGFPWSTFIANLVGTFVLGWLAGGLWTRPSTPAWMKAGIGSGLIGSFTTLSAVMGAVAILDREEATALAALYLGASLVAGLALAAAGLKLGSALAHRPMPTEVTDDGATL